MSGSSDDLNNAAIRSIDQGRYSEAEPIFQRALDLRRASFGEENYFTAQSIYNLGYLYRLEGRYGEAEPLLRRALAIRERILQPDQQAVFAQNLNELGYVYQLQGRYGEAEGMYKGALALQQKVLKADDPAVADSLTNLGDLNRELGHGEQAVKYWTDSLAIREQLVPPNPTAVGQALNNLGVAFAMQGRAAEAEQAERRGLALREKTLGPDHPEVGESLHDLGKLYLAQRRYAEAEPLLKRSLGVYEKALGPDHPDVATKSLGALTALYTSQGRGGEALAMSTRAADVLQRHLTATGGQRSTGATSEQRLYRGEFMRHIALLNGSLTGAEDVATGGPVDRSFRAAQLASASSAGQAVASMAARFASGSDQLGLVVRQLQDTRERWQQLDAAIVRSASQRGSQRDAPAESALRRSFEETDRQLVTLEAKITQQFPAYANLTSPAPLSTRAVRDLLQPDEAFLAYLTGENETWLWAVRGNNSALYRIDIGARALALEVGALRARLDPWQNPSVAPFPARRAFALYQKIMAPAAEFLRGARQVLVVPDGALQSLPLGVLVTALPATDPVSLADHRNVAWLVRDYAMTVLPSVRSLQALRSFTSPSRAALPFVGIGDPDLSGPPATDRSAGNPASISGRSLGGSPLLRQAGLFRGASVNTQAVRELPPLPETSAELHTIARALGASDDVLYLRQRASEPVIRAAHLDQYRIVEFATYGLMSGDLGLGEPALVLTPPDAPTPANDGLLTASKIATMSLAADWVVLSACNTAANDGTPDAGGLSGLAKAFFYAGARSILVSHWSVNSIATVKLTTGAFAALAKEPAIGRSEALRRSMLSMMATDSAPEFAHPMAWAPFVLAGEGGSGR